MSRVLVQENGGTVRVSEAALNEIVRRAGVSRGAQVHHFPTKAELVATAVEHVFERRIEEFRAAFARLPDGAHKGVAAIDLLWPMFDGQTFDAWLELAVAARTDPELRDRLTTVTRRFSLSVAETFRELFPVPAGTDPVYDVAPKFIQAWDAITKWIYDPANKDEVLAIAKKTMSVADKPAQNAYDLHVGAKSIAQNLMINEKLMAQFLDNQRRTGTENLPSDAMKYVDNSLVQAALKM